MKRQTLALIALVFLPALVDGQAGGDESRPKTRSARPASITVFPVVLGNAPSEDVANVLGVFLERGGVKQVAIEATALPSERDKSLAEQAAAFGAFVAPRGLATEQALFAAFLGSPKEGVKEIRGVIADRKGNVVWSERQGPGDAAFDEAKPTCPMDCCVLLIKRLRPALKLDDPFRPGAPKGPFAEKVEGMAGMPKKPELDAMRARLAKLKAAGSQATVRVYPARVGPDWSADGAKILAKKLNDAGLMQATAVEKPLAFTTESGPNEQRTLWSGAKSIQEAVRGLGAGSDYLLFVDCLMASESKAGAVHTYLVAPDGGLVIVDYQNDHHEDFTRIAPASAAGCCELAAVRLAGLLR